MLQREIRPLNDPCSLTELHQWLIDYAPLVGKCAAFEGAVIKGACKSLFDNPRMAKARAEWQNARPFPDVRQISLLAMLYSTDRWLDETSETVIRTVSVAVSLMGLPDWLTQSLYTDLEAGTFTAEANSAERYQRIFFGYVDEDPDESIESGHLAAETERAARLSAHL